VARRRRKPRRRRNTGAFILFFLAALVGGALIYKALNGSAPVSVPKQAAPREMGRRPLFTLPPAPQVAEPSAPPTATMKPVGEPSSSPGDHRLAIIIDDCGQWPQTERALIALPIAITMSVMPKERYTREIAQAASDAGKGVMLHLPMEPAAAIDPGPGKITTQMSDAEVAAQVKEDLAAVPLAKGVNNHEGSKATSDARIMRDVASVLAPTGLFFIDSRTSAQSVAAQIAGEAGIKTASRDVFLDNEDNVDAVEKMLRSAGAVALKSGSAIAIGHPRAATLEAIRTLIPEFQSQGITFTLASEMVH